MIQSDSGKWLLTDSDIKIRADDMEIDNEKIVSLVETWFDVDQRFGLSTGDSDYINLYAAYDPKNENLELYYIYVSAAPHIGDKEVAVEDFDGKEKETVLRLMKQAGLDELVKTTLRYKMEDCFMGYIRDCQARAARFNPEDILRDSNDFNNYLTALIENVELHRRIIDIATDEDAPIKAVRNLLKLDDPLQVVHKKCLELHEADMERIGCFEADSAQCYEAFEQAAEDDYEQ